MPKSALPEGFNNEQTGDWNFWPFKYIRPSITAFGPRCTEWWACWRAIPLILLGFKGQGFWRIENDESEWAVHYLSQIPTRHEPDLMPFYASAIQYWTKWHIQLKWPFFLAFHYYLSEVPHYPFRPKNERVIYLRIGARRNADGFYDFPSAFIGLHWS